MFDFLSYWGGVLVAISAIIFFLVVLRVAILQPLLRRHDKKVLDKERAKLTEEFGLPYEDF